MSSEVTTPSAGVRNLIQKFENKMQTKTSTKTKFTSECTALPQYQNNVASWQDMETPPELPVNEGDTVQVTCKDGFSQSGDRQITCDHRYRDSYEYATRPRCVLEEGGLSAGKLTHHLCEVRYTLSTPAIQSEQPRYCV